MARLSSSFALVHSVGRFKGPARFNADCQTFQSSCVRPFLKIGYYRCMNQFHTCKLWMMPEGPEVKTLVNQLQPAVGMRLMGINFVSGRYITHGSPKGYTEFYKTMTTRDSSRETIDIVTDWRAKGKFMYLLLDNGVLSSSRDGSYSNSDQTNDDFQRSIWITLGLSGRFANEKEVNNKNVGPPPRWYFEFWDVTSQSSRKIFYMDSRNFGTLRFSLSKKELQEKLDSLGPDFLSDDDNHWLTLDMFLKIVNKQRPQMNICKFLMDQKRISGIGNYLLAEGLYKAKVDPFSSLCEISENQLRDLFQQLQTTAKQSYLANGVTRSSGGSYADYDGAKGKFVLECYGREIASNNQPVIRDLNGPHGRTIWYTKDQLFMPLDKRRSKLANNDLIGFKPKSADGADSFGEKFSAIEERLPGQTSELSPAMQSLCSYLTEQSWIDVLSSYMSSSLEFKRLADFLLEEDGEGATVFPPKQNIFAALNLCPFDEVKVVIIGQDPYFNPKQGHGLAFSVPNGVPIPPSLRNIYKEAMDDVNIRPPTSGCLESWAKQGVLLLNAVLTVRSGKANSHSGKGWEDFRDQVIQVLNDKRDSGLVFLLWGSPAAKKASRVDDRKHIVIKCSHPSPLSAAKTNLPFLGSKCFSKANAALEDFGEEPIDWNVRSF